MSCKFYDCPIKVNRKFRGSETDDGSSAWMVNTDLTPLDPETCKNPETKGKSKILLAAYEEAAEGQSLAYYKGVLNDHQAALQADKDAAPAQDTKKSKSKRKSVDTSALAGDIDDMDIDEETVADKPKSKKRKKEVEADDTEEKVPIKTNVSQSLSY